MDAEKPENMVEMEFFEVDDEQFETHLKNHGKIQQTNFTGQDRIEEQPVLLCGRLVEVVHGERSFHDAKAKKPCTLAVFEWYVHTNEPGKRIKFAKIKMRFTSKQGSKYDPAVVDCFPWGAFSLFSTPKQVEKTKGWHPSVKLGHEGIATTENAFIYDFKECLTRKEHIYVDGCPVPGKQYDDPDWLSGVQWNLFEGKGQKSGIPRYFRTAVFLERRKDDTSCFTAKVDTKVKVAWFEDAKENIKSLLGQSLKDDPIIFDPSEPPRSDRTDFMKPLDEEVLENKCVFLQFRELSRGEKNAPDTGKEERKDPKEE